MLTERVDWSDIRPGDAIVGGDGAWWYVVADAPNDYGPHCLIAMVRADGGASAIGTPSGPVTRAVPGSGLEQAIRNLRDAGFLPEVIA